MDEQYKRIQEELAKDWNKNRKEELLQRAGYTEKDEKYWKKYHDFWNSIFWSIMLCTGVGLLLLK